MLEIKYKELGFPNLLYRIYIIEQDPEDPDGITYIYMGTNYTFQPIQYGQIHLISRLSSFMRKFTDIYDMDPIHPRDIQNRINQILSHAAQPLGSEEAQCNTLILMDLAEAYLQLYDDLENNVPMHKMCYY